MVRVVAREGALGGIISYIIARQRSISDKTN